MQHSLGQPQIETFASQMASWWETDSAITRARGRTGIRAETAPEHNTGSMNI